MGVFPCSPPGSTRPLALAAAPWGFPVFLGALLCGWNVWWRIVPARVWQRGFQLIRAAVVPKISQGASGEWFTCLTHERLASGVYLQGSREGPPQLTHASFVSESRIRGVGTGL